MRKKSLEKLGLLRRHYDKRFALCDMREGRFALCDVRRGTGSKSAGPLAAAIRGGNWNNAGNAGVFSLNLNNAPSNTNTNIGFRAASSFCPSTVPGCARERYLRIPPRSLKTTGPFPGQRSTNVVARFIGHILGEWPNMKQGLASAGTPIGERRGKGIA